MKMLVGERGCMGKNVVHGSIVPNVAAAILTTEPMSRAHLSLRNGGIIVYLIDPYTLVSSIKKHRRRNVRRFWWIELGLA